MGNKSSKPTRCSNAFISQFDVATYFKANSKYVYFQGTCIFEVPEFGSRDIQDRCIRCIDVESRLQLKLQFKRDWNCNFMNWLFFWLTLYIVEFRWRILQIRFSLKELIIDRLENNNNSVQN